MGDILTELILTATLAQDAHIAVHNLHTSSHVATFRGNTSGHHSLFVTDDHVISAQQDKALLNVYRWNKEAIDQKIILPEKLSVLAVSHNWTWIAGGSASGKIYLWENGSGNLMFVRDAHYQPVSKLVFSSDDALLFSGSQDSSINAWWIDQLVDLSSDQDEIRPATSWTAHNLPITDIKIGAGPYVSARSFTASVDQTVKVNLSLKLVNLTLFQVWELADFTLLTTIVLPEIPTCLDIDPAERAIYAGCRDGVIRQIDLYHRSRSDGLASCHAVGGNGSIVSGAQLSIREFKAHSSEITSICLSFDATLLASGDHDGQVYVWDVPTRQVVRKLKSHKGPVTFLSVFLQTEQMVNCKGENQMQPLKRVQNERDRVEHDVIINLTRTESGSSDEDCVEMAERAVSEFLSPTSESALKAQIDSLQADLDKVHGYYEDLRGIHENLWKEHVELQLKQ
ncbi:Pre-rRNA-processing protein IPI3 [Neolecta irregularis DAH-3]|uniref:Pre-rRNA-processing protein IPI3 n=1 Tax=Neolecta irregularis (strain DAH-3) TaxID=1198029 RepID=A0A1U7LK97_NEOID|nr:Pre-rRNA-processing protein IPI3 [Neolecta irregularis DAH-3]|eukprot:OLL23080.1 Pre-rRNA-processing protein IPI3 [Neolecta irregularis DAH-3]